MIYYIMNFDYFWHVYFAIGTVFALTIYVIMRKRGLDMSDYWTAFLTVLLVAVLIQFWLPIVGILVFFGIGDLIARKSE